MLGEKKRPVETGIIYHEFFSTFHTVRGWSIYLATNSQKDQKQGVQLHFAEYYVGFPHVSVAGLDFFAFNLFWLSESQP